MFSTLSVCIPRISIHFDHSMIAAEFKASFLVSVYRVDFVPREDNKLYQTVFVYFTYDSSGYFSQCILDKIRDKDDAQQSYKMHISSEEYWWVLPNRYPVLETTMNKHQLAETSRLLELRIHQLETLMTQQMNHLAYVQSLVQQPQSFDYDDDDMPDLLSVEDLQSDVTDDESSDVDDDMPDLISIEGMQ